MKIICLIMLCLWSFWALGQAEYFTPQNKEEGLSYYKNLLYKGCTSLKKRQEPISAKEMERIIPETIRIVERNFSQAFKENPKIKTAFEKEMNELMKNPHCQLEANDCRAKALGLSMFYYHRMRADIPACKNAKGDGNNKLCESEKKYRERSFQGIRDVDYDLSDIAIYKRSLVQTKNNITLNLFRLIVQKDNTDLHICETPESGPVHKYHMDIEEPGIFFDNIDPDYDIRKKIAKECKEKKVSLFGEFYPSNFDKDRSTVGLAQVEPVKTKISEYVKSHPEEIVTDVLVTVTSSKIPYYITKDGKKVIDPKSNDRNLSLAKQRAKFIEQALQELKRSYDFRNIRFFTKASLAGPDFQPLDLNERFVTRMTPGYFQKLEALYRKYEKHYKRESLKNEPQDLFSEKDYGNVFQAKFKPFHGFRIQLFGYRKDEMKCSVRMVETPDTTQASRQ